MLPPPRYTFGPGKAVRATTSPLALSEMMKTGDSKGSSDCRLHHRKGDTRDRDANMPWPCRLTAPLPVPDADPCVHVLHTMAAAVVGIFETRPTTQLNLVSMLRDSLDASLVFVLKGEDSADTTGGDSGEELKVVGIDEDGKLAGEGKVLDDGAARGCVHGVEEQREKSHAPWIGWGMTSKDVLVPTETWSVCGTTGCPRRWGLEPWRRATLTAHSPRRLQGCRSAMMQPTSTSFIQQKIENLGPFHNHETRPPQADKMHKPRTPSWLLLLAVSTA